MKKLSIALLVAALLALTTATASAELWDDYVAPNNKFVDRIEYWTLDREPAGTTQELGEVDSVLITETFPLTYTHTISDFIIPDEYLVTQAYLNLDFTNDNTDSVDLIPWTTIIAWDNREYVEVAWDGSAWYDLDEVNPGQYTLAVGIDWLNDDGELDVTISVSNPGWNDATAWLDHSVLYGNVARVPVPGAVLLGVLGLSAAGIKLRKNRAA